jgi:hypothetical protein
MRFIYLWAVAIFALAHFIVPASAADPTSTSLYSLLAAGYEVKNATPVSAAATKEIWTGQYLPPQIIVTLQKANSIAVCNLATINWMSLTATTFASTDRCVMR